MDKTEPEQCYAVVPARARTAGQIAYVFGIAVGLIGGLIGIIQVISDVTYVREPIVLEVVVVAFGLVDGLVGVTALGAGLLARRWGIVRDERDLWFKTWAGIAAGIAILCLYLVFALTALAVRFIAVPMR